MMKRLEPILVLISLLLIPQAVRAQLEPSPPPAVESREMVLFQNIPSVYGASRYEQRLKEAPSFVSIVTADDIKKFGYRTLADILRGVTGFFTTFDRNYSFLGLRGFGRPGDYNSRVLLLVDGHRINDGLYDSAPIGTDFILDVDLIERVEVIRGPSSSLYGANAFLGVINVITRRGRDLKGTELSGEAASFGTYKGRATYGNRFKNGLEMIASGTYYDSSGQDHYYREFDRPRTNNGLAEDCDDDRFHSLFTKISYGDFAFEGAYVDREKGIPTGSWGTVFNDPGSRTTDSALFMDLKYEHSFDNQLTLSARAYFDKYDYDGRYMYEDDSSSDRPGTIPLTDFGRARQAGAEVQARKTLFDKHTLIGGMEYRNNFRQDQGACLVEDFLDSRKQSSVWAIYLQDEYRILDDLILNAGVRHDQYDTFGGTTNPRVALLYYPFDKTTVKLLYGSAFRPPNAYELYYEDPESQDSNPDLMPETIRTYELVLEQYLGDGLRITASGFYYSIDDLISQETDETSGHIRFENADTVTAKGGELELERRWANGINSRLGYAFVMTEDQETGKTLSNSPLHMAKFNLLVPLMKDKLFAGLELDYLSERKTLDERHVDDVFLCNLTLYNRDLIKGLELSASVYNLFDMDMRDPGAEEHLQDAIRQDGINFRLKLTYSF